jgi:hypothetical protein
MRLFLTAAALTVLLGFGAATLLAAEPAKPGPSVAAASDVRAPQGGQYLSLDRALVRLELEARIEDYYAELAEEAQGLSRLERLELFHQAEAELRDMVLESETYGGEHRVKGEDYLARARHALAYHLGLDETPA